jgi:predicted protein tyrosine phosphatase
MYDLALGNRNFDVMRALDGFGAASLSSRHLSDHSRLRHADIVTHADRLDAESGEVHYRKALAFAQPRGMRPLAAHCHLGLGKLYRRTGKREQAQVYLTIATTMYRERDMTYWSEKAGEAMRQLA